MCDEYKTNIYIYIIIYIYTWVIYNDLTVLPHQKWWLLTREIIPFYGRTIQLSELFYFAQMSATEGVYTYTYIYIYVYTQPTWHVWYFLWMSWPWSTIVTCRGVTNGDDSWCWGFNLGIIYLSFKPSCAPKYKKTMVQAHAVYVYRMYNM